jgi:gamma-glutamyl-gamma-aminobutyraldehyde dehydrogenase/4-guanidinobutyraldehyde dehydrogenase/NAD-dependent aldehyde dehydrogenase
MTAINWHHRAREARFATEAFINGRYIEAASGRRFARTTPIDGTHLADVAFCDETDVDNAVSAARAAFNDRRWAGLSPQQRKKILLKAADLIDAHSEELALTETLDMGKPISDSLAVDIPGTSRCLRWFAESIDKIYDEIAPTAADSLALITREPVGVVGAVVPWNFPLIMAMWKIAPALAAGNSVILKPAEQSPLSALRLAALFVEAGLPDGVFNVVPGDGAVTGRAIGMHMDIDAVGFTGSTEIGKMFLQYSGQSNMKRVWLECGGKSPVIIMRDCLDLDRAATIAAGAIFYNQGEMCTAGSRLLLDAPIRDAFLARMVTLAKEQKLGDPLDPKTTIGALVEEKHLCRVLDYIDIGRKEGANLLIGGVRAREETGGFYLEPTIFDRVTPNMRIAQEEIFGPVLSVIDFDGIDQAIKIANGTKYGLASSIFTQDLNTALRASRALRSGLVYVNCFDADDATVPFGGFGQSGNGRDKSLHAFDKYTELKTTWIALS